MHESQMMKTKNIFFFSYYINNILNVILYLSTILFLRFTLGELS